MCNKFTRTRAPKDEYKKLSIKQKYDRIKKNNATSKLKREYNAKYNIIINDDELLYKFKKHRATYLKLLPNIEEILQLHNELLASGCDLSVKKKEEQLE